MKRKLRRVLANQNNGYRYLTKHGIGPGTIPRDVQLLDWEDLDNYMTAIWVDRPLTLKELDYYGIYPEYIQASRDMSVYRNSRHQSQITSAKKPKYWNTRFKDKVIDAYESGELTLQNIHEWETEYNDGVVPHPSLGTREILQYYLSTL